MPRAPPPLMVVLTAVALFLWFIIYTTDHRADNFPAQRSQPIPKSSDQDHLINSVPDTSFVPAIPSSVQHGAVIAPKLANETAKAELGRAAWKLFHTTMARFPDTPTQDQSDALRSYIYLFARLYPCGECAEHFQGILKKYPPQTSSRSTAAAWACFVHNEVNISKGKPVWDCANIGDFYDCGCADDEKEAEKKGQVEASGKRETVEIETDGLIMGG